MSPAGSRVIWRFPKAAFLLTVFVILLNVHQALVWRENAGEAAGESMYVPQAEAIRPFLLGQEALLADLIWIRTLGYFADELLGRQRYTYLEDLLNLATDLDPRFERVYLWAGAVLMYNSGRISAEKIMASTRFLEKGWAFIRSDPAGWRHDPEYWRIPQMIGFNYAMELHDKVKGAPFIADVARIPGSPDFYKTWAATLFGRAGDIGRGIRFLEDMLAIETLQSQMESVEDKEIKERIRLRLFVYLKRLYGEDAEERLKFVEARISRWVTDWRASLPYAGFNLFLVLSPSEADTLESESERSLWMTLFPLTGAA